MAVSGKDLDRQVQDLLSLCPKLQPGIVPQGYNDADLRAYAEAEGASACTALQQFCAAEGQRVKACCVCGVEGEAGQDDDHHFDDCEREEGRRGGGGGGSDDEDESSEATRLRFTTFSRLSFLRKTLELTHAGFACGRCRAMRDVRRFVHFAAMRLGPAHLERGLLANELCAHFVATNRVGDAILGNSNAYVVWVQEVYSRAYALQVVASNIQGWKVVGPSGEPIQRGTPGATLALAHELLKAKARKKKSSRMAKAAGGRLLAAPAVAATDATTDGLTRPTKGKKSRTAAKADSDAPSAPSAVATDEGVAQPAVKGNKKRRQSAGDGLAVPVRAADATPNATADATPGLARPAAKGKKRRQSAPPAVDEAPSAPEDAAAAAAGSRKAAGARSARKPQGRRPKP